MKSWGSCKVLMKGYKACVCFIKTKAKTHHKHKKINDFIEKKGSLNKVIWHYELNCWQD